jgi:hypothetical protein
MTAVASPSPFLASSGFTIAVSGGVQPYDYAPLASPPNPAGVVVTSVGPPAQIDVPSNTPSGTIIYVSVSDSSTPPQVVVVVDRVA